MKASPESGFPGALTPPHYHYHMLRDKERCKAFKEAIQLAVPKDGKVLELGGGSGILSHFAAQKASKVYYVEKLPEMVRAANRFLTANGTREKIDLILADANEFVPPEPVDVVICEMVHAAMLRESQMQIIAGFKKRYLAKFGKPLPYFIPEAAILAVQPVEQNFNFSGYVAPVPIFYDPYANQEDTKELGAPLNYQTFQYREDYSVEFQVDETLTIEKSGVLNALRFVTKNIVYIVIQEHRTIDWFNQYLIVPTPTEIPVAAGDKVRVHFNYTAANSVESLASAITVQKA